MKHKQSRSTFRSTGRSTIAEIRKRAARWNFRFKALFKSPPPPEPHCEDQFFKLPPELRVMVYEFALQFERPIRKSIPKHEPPKGRVPGILLVNRLAYAEAMPILYEVNTISIKRSDLCMNQTKPALTFE